MMIIPAFKVKLVEKKWTRSAQVQISVSSIAELTQLAVYFRADIKYLRIWNLVGGRRSTGRVVRWYQKPFPGLARTT